MLKVFADLRLDSVILWPSDQGDCTCADCAPWGGNGYLCLNPQCTKLIRSCFPNAKIILSTWYFDRFTNGEWDAFFRAANMGALPDIDYLLASGVRTGYSGWKNFNWISFPEISMAHCAPWGSYGASILQGILQQKLVPELPKMSGFPIRRGSLRTQTNFWLWDCIPGICIPKPIRSTRSYDTGFVSWDSCALRPVFSDLHHRNCAVLP